MYSVIKHRCQPASSIKRLTIRELNLLLDKLAHAEPGKAKLSVLTEIHQRSTAAEQRWILRIIVKDLSIAMKEDTLFKLLHPDAHELYNSVCDLRSTCEQCDDPDFSSTAISMQVRPGAGAPHRRRAAGTPPRR